MSELMWALSLAVALLLAFWFSNYFHARGMAFYLSRKVAHFGAGLVIVAFPLVFQSLLYPVVLPAMFLLLLAATHRSEVFHGFVKKGRLSELHFATSVLVCMLAAWRLNPWLAVMPALFLSFGDGITGLVRYKVYRREVKGTLGSLAMLLVCSAIAVPVLGWIGGIGSLVATVAEKQPWVDDNLASPLAALAVLVPLWLWT